MLAQIINQPKNGMESNQKRCIKHAFYELVKQYLQGDFLINFRTYDLESDIFWKVYVNYF